MDARTFQPENQILYNLHMRRTRCSDRTGGIFWRSLSQFHLFSRIPGISSFYDLYQSVLEQYEAESFNDSLFASYLLFPLQQRHG